MPFSRYLPALRYHGTTLVVGGLYVGALYLILTSSGASTVAALWASLPGQ